MVKPASARDAGPGRSPGEGNGNPLQYCCLGTPMNRGAWRATVHGVAKSPLTMNNNRVLYSIRFIILFTQSIKYKHKK